MQWYTKIVARIPPITPPMKNTAAVVETAIPTTALVVNDSALPEGKEKHAWSQVTLLLITRTLVKWYQGVIGKY